MFFKRNRVKLRQWGRQFGRGRQNCPCASGACLSLQQLSEGTNAIIVCNNNLRTIERGLYLGRQITLFRNNLDEPNLIVAVGDARYVLDRRIAREIMVKII